MESKVPQWLQNAQIPTHRQSALQTLTRRERMRHAARSASAHKANESLRYGSAPPASAAAQEEDKEVEHYSIAIGMQPDNRMRNRYSGVEPYDRTRVVVGCGDSCEPSGRYLNASWVRELHGGKWWIAQQAPLPETVHAFLSIILQPTFHPPTELHPRTKALQPADSSRVRTVVQLTQIMENGMRKAHIYFPAKEGESMTFEPEEGFKAPSYKVTLVSSTEVQDAHCVRSTVSVQPVTKSGEDAGELVTFTHLLFSDWPDHGVPEKEHRAGLLNFIKLVDTVNRDITTQPEGSRAGLDPDPPIIVNCSAGIGRTGSFIALSSLLREAGWLLPVQTIWHDAGASLPELTPTALDPLPAEFKEDKVAQEVDALREQRPGMVQKQEQAILIYDTLVLAFDPDSEEKSSEEAAATTDEPPAK